MAKVGKPQPIIELMSLAAGGGTTHMLYHLCSLAVLPTHVGGSQSSVVIIDTDGSFDVDRLATLIQKSLREGERQSYSNEDPVAAEVIEETTLSALKHVHVVRPQSLASTIATLASLSTYLFDPHRHYSYDRRVAFIAIDSASAFYWQDQAETEDAAFVASTATSSREAKLAKAKAQSGYVKLADALKHASKAFYCPAIITSWHLSLVPSGGLMPRSFRSQLPAIQPTVRLVVHRLPVRKFPSDIGVQQALREAANRQKAVDESKFECFVNEWGVEEKLLREIERVGASFVFSIDEEGMRVDAEISREEA